MDIEKLNITRVWVGNDFYVDILPDEIYFEFWLHKKGYGKALYMFTTACDSEQYKKELIKNNIDDYIKIYNTDLIE